MTKTLTKHGNSYALVIDLALMDVMHINEKTSISLTISGDRLVVTPDRNGERRPNVMEAYAHVSKKHAAFLKRLA